MSFSINKRYLQLSILGSIINSSKIFFFAFCYINSEYIFILRLIEIQLNELLFYNSLYLKVIYDYFTKSLPKVVIT